MGKPDAKKTNTTRNLYNLQKLTWDNIFLNAYNLKPH